MTIFMIITITLGCAHYSNEKRAEVEKTIHAPVDVVWEKTLEILSTERISFGMINALDYSFSGDKQTTFWSDGDTINVKLIPKGKKQTTILFDAKAHIQFIGWGHQERMVKNIFHKIKDASESKVASISINE